MDGIKFYYIHMLMHTLTLNKAIFVILNHSRQLLEINGSFIILNINFIMTNMDIIV